MRTPPFLQSGMFIRPQLLWRSENASLRLRCPDLATYPKRTLALLAEGARRPAMDALGESPDRLKGQFWKEWYFTYGIEAVVRQLDAFRGSVLTSEI
jgi:hypothetical protein